VGGLGEYPSAPWSFDGTVDEGDPSSSGKSSLILALFRGLEPSLLTGSIVIDGVDSTAVPLERWRKSLR